MIKMDWEYTKYTDDTKCQQCHQESLLFVQYLPVTVQCFHVMVRSVHCVFLQQTSLGCCVGRSPNLFFNTTRCLENLSSGENLAGWAERVGRPMGSIFCQKKDNGDIQIWLYTSYNIFFQKVSYLYLILLKFTFNIQAIYSDSFPTFIHFF